MAIPILQDWTLLINEGGLSASAELPQFPAGQNRIVEILSVVYAGSTLTTLPTNISADEVPAALVVGNATQNRVSLGVHQFLEGQIPLIEGKPLVSTGASGTNKTILYRVLGNCKQVVPSNKGVVYTQTGGSLSLPLPRAKNSFTTALALSSTNTQSVGITNPARVNVIPLTSTRRVSYGSADDTENTSNTVFTATAVTAGVAYNREEAPLQNITAVNGGNGVRAGSTGNKASVTGFAIPPTSGTIGGVAFTNFSYSAGEVSFSLPMYDDGAIWPSFNGPAEVRITDGVDTPILAEVPVLPPAGWAAIVMQNPITDDRTFLGFHTNIVGHEIAYNTENGAIEMTPDGGFKFATPGMKQFYKRNISTGLVTLLNIRFNSSGTIVGRRFRARLFKADPFLATRAIAGKF
jgi:hypothetical protein